jgi:GTP-binding protein EngB required for normal cell division
LSDTDKATVTLISKTLASRKDSGLPPFLYAILLTKIDKASDRDIASVRKAVDAALSSYPSNSDEAVQVVVTSSVTKEGRDSVWSILGRKVYAIKEKQ